MRALGRGRSHMYPEKLSWKRLAFPVFVFIVFPGAVAYAGFLSDVYDLLGKTFSKPNIQEKALNSQSIPLGAMAAGVGFAEASETPEVNTVGGGALLADAGPSGGMADVNTDEYDHGQISTYVVREGDTFSSIATMFDVSVNTILWANNLPRGTKLTVGQTLAILPVSGVQYVVKRGDTIAGIAKKFRGDLDEVRMYNGLAPSDKLEVGMTIIIPDGELPAATINYRPATSKLRGASGPAYDGYYQAPFASYRKTQGLHGYNGVDLVATAGFGAPVLAAAGGQVIIARQGGYNGGYGSYVVIQHGNGTQTLYGHLRSVAVSAGAIVFSGEMIGYMGNTGRSTGTHLHFEVRGARNPFSACPFNVPCAL